MYKNGHLRKSLPRPYQTRGVTYDKRDQAWVASMTRRHMSFVDKFSELSYGEEVAFALAIIRRTQMELYWGKIKSQYLGKANNSRNRKQDDSDTTDVEPLEV